MAETNFYELDFDNIKDDIKDYIKNNCEYLGDYNYEGSAISEIINVLAYVTQNNSFYLNMVANELFLATAEIKKNVYKIATQLGYVPTRASAPYIVATITNTHSSSAVNVPRYTEFLFGGTTLVTLEDLSVSASSSSTITLHTGNIVYATISVPEVNENGFYITSTSDNIEFTDSLQQYLKYNLDDYEMIDENYLYVFDLYGIGSTETEWKAIHNENPILGEKYYYLNFHDNLQLMFDNGSFYSQPISGSNLYVHYLLSTGTLYNNTSGVLSLNSSFSNSTYLSVTTGTGILENGSDPESIASVRNNAPLFYTTNNRAVTESDWNELIKKYSAYSTFQDFYIWGGNREYVNSSYQITGDDSDYKDVGYVYNSGLKSNEDNTCSDYEYDYSYISAAEKILIENFLIKYKILTLFYKWLDPNIIFFTPSISVKQSTGFVDSTTISYQIDEYLKDNYLGFDKKINKSNLTKFVDSLSEVSYSDLEYTTYVKVLNNSGYLPTASTLSDTSVLYEDWKVIRFNNTLATNSIRGYLATFETLTEDATIYNNSYFVSGTHSGEIIDNNYASANLIATTSGLWHASLKLDSASTLASTDVLEIYKDGTTLASNVTIDSIYTMHDSYSLPTLGYLLLDAVTIGQINYNTGFVTISTTSSTISDFITYSFSFNFETQRHNEFEKETFLSPTPIRLTTI